MIISKRSVILERVSAVTETVFSILAASLKAGKTTEILLIIKPLAFILIFQK
jgi:hypothetical protein